MSMPAEPFGEILSHLNLKDLQSVSLSSKTLRADVQKEYWDRYIRITEPYLLNNASFANIMRVTGAVISGSTAFYYANPYNEDPVEHAQHHDLDIYVKRNQVQAMLDHFFDVQEYTLAEGPYVKGQMKSDTPAFYSDISGMYSVHILRRGNLRVDIVASDSDDTPLLPITCFHSTIVMNVLTPNHYISFYPRFTLEGKGLIHHLSYLDRWSLTGAGEHTLRPRAFKAINKYIDRGFTLKDNPVDLEYDHARRCKYGRCRLRRYVDDSQVLHITFGCAENVAASPSPTNPVVSWSLGGYECGRGPSSGVYESIMCQVL